MNELLNQIAPQEPSKQVPGSKPLPEEYFELKSRIHNRLLDLLDLSIMESMDKEQLATQIRQIVQKIMRDEAANTPLNMTERERLAGEILDEVLGLGPIEPLLPGTSAELRVGPDGLRHGSLHLPLAAIRVTSTERADTLQVATLDRMWQFRMARGSAFRFQWALDRWRAQAPERPGFSRQVGGDPWLAERR